MVDLVYGLPWLLLIVYAIWQWRNLGWWQQGIAASKAETETTLPAVSILIPARNEAENIGLLLGDLLAQASLTDEDEIIVIDDHSTDSTASIVRSFFPRVRLLGLANYLNGEEVIAHKKAALTYGIAQSKQTLVVSTDADCRWGENVLTHIKTAAAKGHEFIAGPVLIAPATNHLSGFQALDMLAYMLLTGAYSFAKRPILANGAHLSFTRQLFETIEGYRDIDHIPSGDDVLLLQKTLGKRPETRFHFLTNSEAVVTTKPMPDLNSFWAQRLRWAGKTASYTSSNLRFAQALSFAVSVVIFGQLFLGIWWPMLFYNGLGCWLLKAIVDFVLLRSSSVHFERKHWMKYYPLTQLLQPVYLLLIGSAALLGLSSSWKGR